MIDFPPFSVADAADALKGADALVLIHKNPDGDAIGSAVALMNIIRQTGGRAKGACADPIPERLAFLSEGEDFVYRPGEENGRTVIAVDVASPPQLGAIASLADQVDFAVDHHAVGTRFAPTLCDSAASSAGEIVWRIARCAAERHGIELNTVIARSLYAAISSDTGSFKYSNTSPATHRTAAELTEIIDSAGDGGYDTSDMARLLFDTKTTAELRADAIAARRLTVRCGGRLAMILITAEDCREAGVSMEDASNAVDVARSVSGALAGVCVKEKGGGEYRVSARSNCDFNVADVCASFGGGGHVRAAGASVFADSAREAMDVVLSAFTKALEVYENG